MSRLVSCVPLTPGPSPARGEGSRSHNVARYVIVALSYVAITLAARNGHTAENDGLFRRNNLVAWCIVPFDAKKRGPEERAAMLEKLGFKHFAYDYRPEHVPTFEAEIEACKRHGVSLDAWWFPGTLNDEAKHILALCQKHRVHPQLWISGGGAAPRTPAEFKARVEQEANRIRPIAEAAAAQDMKVGLYNHGGWFGEPETQLAIIQELKLPNVGIVYNQHHGHAHVGRFAEILKKTLPHLLCVNINGMDPAGDQQGRKILQLGQGSLDLELLRILRDSGYRGPVGILGHTQDDAELRLRDNLDGLDWLHKQLLNVKTGGRPHPRTPLPGAKPRTSQGSSLPATPKAFAGYLAPGKADYSTLPLTVGVGIEILRGKNSYNILAANDVKSSSNHWELFTMPKTGFLTAYLPGATPDHVRSTVDICDGHSHTVQMTNEPNLVKLYVDGRVVAEQILERKPRALAQNGVGLCIGALVEGRLDHDGILDYVRIAKGTRLSTLREWNAKDEDVLGYWVPNSVDADYWMDNARANHAKLREVSTAKAADNKAPEPPPGVHLKPVDPRLKVTLIDRSPDQVYMGVKVDRDGHVFVGGREGVFVFETLGDDKFAPRQEILRFPQDSIIMGLEFRDDDLFVLTCNALYRVPKGRVQRTNLKPERILWGLPLDLHVSFHCLAWSPAGMLYITHGDPWLGLGDWSRPDHWGHWILYSRGKGEGGGGKDSEPGALATGVSSTPHLSNVDKSWRETPYCGQGAVLQFDVETGAVEPYATGLRGPVGLAFDDCGVLITNDNDHEGRADQYAPARLLHVVQGIDFGWPRGWMASKSPDRYDLIEPMCDLGRGVPCDLAAYPFSVPDKLVGQLLHCRWDRHAVTTIDIPHSRYAGAVERPLLQGAENCRPVGIAVGSAGEMFVTSVYMTGNMAAPYCQSDLCLVTFTDGARPFKSSLTRGSGRSADPTYERQLNVRRLSNDNAINAREFARILSGETDTESRLQMVLAIGRTLTVPPVDYVPPVELPLVYPQESSFFKRKQKFWGSDEAVDLADFARIGSFTIAGRWKALPHTDDEEKLFALLVTALDDRSDAVRLQAAYYLSLLNDPRSEPLVEKTRRDVLLKRLAAGKWLAVREAWRLGPWPDGDDAELRKPHPPELGTLDLSASYQAGKRSIAWESSTEGLRIGHASEKEGDRVSTYFAFRATSGTRQKALARFVFDRPSKLFVNGSDCGPRVEIAPPGEFRSTENNELRQWPAATAWIVDLQPGSNELLLRVQTDSADARKLVHHGQSFHLSLETVDALEISLPEKLDSGVLTARLREASAAGGLQPIGAEFLEKDWTKEHLSGDPATGRKLFGTLGCAKCHAIVPDQKSAGAPSLFEARRRFTVPHLVESLLLPSRQVAEPFRAQQITTDDGLTLTGLVTAETGENLELLLPDASRRTISKKQIEARTATTLSPMPQGLIKTPDELRHLLAYLLSERPTPP